MSPSRLRIERRDAPGSVTFVLAGQFNLDAVGNVGAVLDGETMSTSAAVVLDLAHLELLTVAGIDLLIGFARRLATQRRRLRVAATNPVIDEAFALAGVELIDDGDLVVPTRRTSRVPDPTHVPDSGHDSRLSTSASTGGAILL